MNAIQVISILKSGGVGVLPTDTLYGLVGSAMSPESVERLYTLRKRDTQKPMIILVSSLDDLNLFDIRLDEKIFNFLKTIWPAKISVVLPVPGEKFQYLHRGTQTLAFRVPDKDELRRLLEQTGPLCAPSANFEGQKEATTIDEAKAYFGNQADFYIDEGPLQSQPSTLVTIVGDKIHVLREGAQKVQTIF